MERGLLKHFLNNIPWILDTLLMMLKLVKRDNKCRVLIDFLVKLCTCKKVGFIF